MNLAILESEKRHLAEFLEAIQRCVYFLDASSRLLKNVSFEIKKGETVNYYWSQYKSIMRLLLNRNILQLSWL